MLGQGDIVFAAFTRESKQENFLSYHEFATWFNGKTMAHMASPLGKNRWESMC